jgi:hypothetical protein
MTEYSKIARGRFTSTGGAQVVNLPFIPGTVEIWNYSAQLAAPAANAVVSAYWDSGMGQGFAAESVYNATPALSSDVVVTGGISTFQAGQLLQYGPTLVVSGITKASPAVVTTSVAHNLTSGDVVILEGLFETTTTGMPQINGLPFTVTVLSPTTFSIPWNTNQTNYTVIDGGATGTPRMKKVLYPYLYFPGQTFISTITLGTTTTITTTDAHNFRVGQEVAFRIPSQWGTVELNSLPNIPIPGSPIYGYVITVTDYQTVVVNINSSAYTAFNSNQTVASVPGLSYPQIVAVGDVNTGGETISLGSPLYPSPMYEPIGTTQFPTINGPAIRGAFVNNTSQGFIVGSGAGTNRTASVLVGAAGNIIYWRAMLYDIVLGEG